MVLALTMAGSYDSACHCSCSMMPSISPATARVSEARAEAASETDLMLSGSHRSRSASVTPRSGRYRNRPTASSHTPPGFNASDGAGG